MMMLKLLKKKSFVDEKAKEELEQIKALAEAQGQDVE